MTRKRANELDNELKDYLENASSSQDVDGGMGTYLVDNFIEFFPEEDMKGMIFLGRSAVSYKAGNVKIDLKKALTNAIEYTASVNKPESAFGVVQLIILSVMFVYKTIKRELNGLESHLVYFLHAQGAYARGIEEEQFIRDFEEWYHKKTGTPAGRNEIIEAINLLYEYKVADFENGNIVLKEKVWGEM